MNLRPLIGVVLAAFLSGCAFGPDPVAPPLDMPGAYSSAIPSGIAGEADTWWEGFDDPLLTETISLVRENNLDVAQALAGLDAASALRRAARSDLFPVVDGTLDVQQRAELAGDGEESTTTATGGLSMAFTPDINGRRRRLLDAALADLDAAAEDVEDARRIATRAAALQYIELRRSGARLALLETSLDLQSRTLDIVRSRYDAGLSPALDVDRAAADLARTRADRGILQANRQDAGFALSILAGNFPGDGVFGSPEEDIIPDFGGGPPVSVPAALLVQRPDVKAAEAALIAALARIGVEKADLYPSLRLPGAITAGGPTDGALDDVAGLIVAVVDIPLFDAGRRRAEVRAQEARATAALAAWEISVLRAVQDVESALTQIAALRTRLDNLTEAVGASESAYRQLDALYREGLAGFIDVLDAQRTLISSREQVVDTRADLASAIVVLYASQGL